MSVKIFSCLAIGLEGRLVEVEADISPGLSAFTIVGLGDAAVQEAKERVRSAIKNSGFKYPYTKKIINLAPANLKKHGPQFDLPIAAGLLAASGQADSGKLADTLVVGELALDGSVRPVNGVLTMALFAKSAGWKRVIVPTGNFGEASLVKGLEIIPVSRLGEIFGGARGRHLSQPPETNSSGTPYSTDIPDFADIHGQEQPKRVLEIAAAGAHHILFSGPPGTGKTMLAKAMPGILPPLSEEEMLEVLQIYSCAGLFEKSATTEARPFRQVHNTCSLYALTGGGSTPKPGEISLAHRGVLFLDEIAEFPRLHLESLRQPMESREINLARAAGSLKFPANFMLVAGMNPCPCGYFDSPGKECVCRPYQVIQYQKKLSGPILDRIDLHMKVPRQPVKIFSGPTGETSAQVRERVIRARKMQEERVACTNGQLTASQIKKLIRLSPDCSDFLHEAGEKLRLSGRGLHQVIKISRTIADLAQSDRIEHANVAEALHYRKVE